MRGRSLHILPLLLLLSLPLAGQSAGRVDSIHFLPPEYFVGDTVEMRIVLTAAPGARITPPAALPESDWLLFRNARVEESGGELCAPDILLLLRSGNQNPAGDTLR